MSPKGSVCLYSSTWAEQVRPLHTSYMKTGSLTEVRPLQAPPVCSGSAGASVVAHSVALPLIEIAFATLDCSIVPTCGAWGSATAAKRGPLKQSWVGIQHSRDDEPLGVLMQMRNVRVNGFFFFLLWEC